MDEFTLGVYPQSSILVVFSERESIQLDPDYQRIGGIWTHEKRQLLIDSLVNGFDVPKLYFHEFVPYRQIGSKRYRYAIIDGKQRLQTIWDFIDGTLLLDKDFEYFRDKKVKAGGLSYSQLGQKYPLIKAKFDGTTLNIITIRTEDLELIEDMFSRLNEAVPLNAPEKRNAFGGPMPVVIKDIAKNNFFAKHVPFTDRRYRHRDLSAKFLYLEYEEGIANTKKQELDDFVKEFKRWREKGDSKGSPTAVGKIKSRVEKTLTLMSSVFNTKDKLLGQVGMITLYYHLFRLVRASVVGHVKRDMLRKFDKAREDNRRLAEETSETGTGVNTKLLEFDKHSQTPNDAYAIRIRLKILLDYLRTECHVSVDKAALKDV